MNLWQKSKLGKFIDLLTGYSFKSDYYVESDPSIRLLRGDNVIQGSLRWNNAKRWPLLLSDGLEKYQMQEGDFVIAMDRTWVKSGLKATIVTKRDIPSLLVQRVARLRSKPGLNAYFLSLLIRGHKFEQYVKGVQTETAVPHISAKQIKEFPIVLPPLHEQTAIADFLSTWDTAIEKIERLIAAKEKRFSCLRSRLINHEMVKGKWRRVKLEEVFSERVETQFRDLPLLSITRKEGVIPREDVNRKDTSNSDKSKYLRICTGDIGYNTMRMWQGVSALSKFEGIVSPAYTVCIPSNQLCGEFIAHYFKTPFLIHKFYRFSQGLTSDTWNLKFKHFKEIRVAIPPLRQQKQIASTLNTARQEIDLLKKQADAFRKQKRGLMQKLLTGRWRMKVT